MLGSLAEATVTEGFWSNKFSWSTQVQEREKRRRSRNRKRECLQLCRTSKPLDQRHCQQVQRDCIGGATSMYFLVNFNKFMSALSFPSCAIYAVEMVGSIARQSKPDCSPQDVHTNKQHGILRGLSTMCCCCIGSRKQYSTATGRTPGYPKPAVVVTEQALSIHLRA